MSSSVEISVVIASRNRSAWLLECLRSLESQTIDKETFEVVVVNDGSDDNTSESLREYGTQCDLQLRIIDQDNHGVSFARNVGIEKASASLVAFTDDDCLLPPNWLKTFINEFAELPLEYAGVGGPLNSSTSSEEKLVGRFIRYLDEFNHIPVLGLLRVQPVHVASLSGHEIVPYLRTSNAAFRKEAIEKIGCFDPDFRKPGGEDPDLCYRLMAAGYKIKFLPELQAAHHTRDSFPAYFKSIKNYVCGDFLKSRKKSFYRDSVIRRTYSCIVFQRMVSSLLALLLYPWNCFRAKKRGFPTSDMLLFPLIVICSKFYALWVAICCQFDLLKSKQND